MFLHVPTLNRIICVRNLRWVFQYGSYCVRHRLPVDCIVVQFDCHFLGHVALDVVVLVRVQWNSNHGNAVVNCFLGSETTAVRNEDSDVRVT